MINIKIKMLAATHIHKDIYNIRNTDFLATTVSAKMATSGNKSMFHLREKPIRISCSFQLFSLFISSSFHCWYKYNLG